MTCSIKQPSASDVRADSTCRDTFFGHLCIGCSALFAPPRHFQPTEAVEAEPVRAVKLPARPDTAVSAQTSARLEYIINTRSVKPFLPSRPVSGELPPKRALGSMVLPQLQLARCLIWNASFTRAA